MRATGLAYADGAVVYAPKERPGAVFFYEDGDAIRKLKCMAYDARTMRGHWASCRTELLALQPLHYACFDVEDLAVFFSETTMR